MNIKASKIVCHRKKGGILWVEIFELVAYIGQEKKCCLPYFLRITEDKEVQECIPRKRDTTEAPSSDGRMEGAHRLKDSSESWQCFSF